MIPFRKLGGAGFCASAFETNGNMHCRLLDGMMELVLKSGGCVKFDLKAWDPPFLLSSFT